MFVELNYFLYGVAFGAVVSFAACFVACVAYSRMSGHPSPTGHITQPEPLPFYIKDDRGESQLEKQLLGRDQIDGLGR